MTQVTIAEAQEKLPELIAATQQGEKVVILDQGKTVAALLPSEEEQGKRASLFGAFKGKIWMSEDFDEPLEDLKDYM